MIQKTRELTGQDRFTQQADRLRDALLRSESRQARLSRLILHTTLRNRRIALGAAVLTLVAAAAAAVAFVQSGKVTSLTERNAALDARVLSLEADLGKVRSDAERLRGQVAKLEKSFAQASSEKAQLQGVLDKTQAELASLVEEKVYLEDILIYKTKEIERMGAPGGPEAAEARAELERLRGQNAALAARLDRLYQITSDRLSTLNVARMTMESAMADARKAIEDEWSMVDLGSIRVESPAPAAVAPSAPAVPSPASQPPPQRSAPRSEGRVRAINDAHGFVVIDLGRVDGVAPDSTLDVFRDGKPIAALTVLEIRDIMAACNIHVASKGAQVRVNDQVKIRKE